MRKLDRAGLVRDFNLYPSPTNMITLERKYGDSLNFYDLNGFRQKETRTNSQMPFSDAQGRSPDLTVRSSSNFED
jgi:hypothetical protein